ncbi:40S ribosomal protein S4, X isoform-like [Planoprotostelium fungivorum]|uniref:40S ribosomal protein S4 n=1 Tax=Planoprotostelium fungivorum TaxID=1890364 RepID=A0A2P6MUW7_9EUKA|nr:40S ribosomal protein S4, X isoform-like [Planoprotostelium fungivorum]
MARGPKKHLKRLNAPSHWMLDKLSGVFAPRPSSGPHKLRECLPLSILLRNRLKYALTGREAQVIVKERNVKVDGKVRTDPTYPAGFQDVISIDATHETFRLLYDTKGRFAVHRITPEEGTFKLCRVNKRYVGKNGVPFISTHDGRSIRFADPLIKVNDTIKLDLAENKIVDHVTFSLGNLVTVTGGRNLGRIGVITKFEKHPGSYDIVHIKDAVGHSFATRSSNVFVIGKGTDSLVSLPKAKGIRKSILEEAEARGAHIEVEQHPDAHIV